MKEYKVAYVMESTGDWEIYDHFEAENDEAANQYAAENYESGWYVLDKNHKNINGGR